MNTNKRLLLFILTICLFTLSACGKSSTTAISNKELVKTATLNYSPVEGIYNDVILYEQGSKTGVLTNDGSVRIEAQYDVLKALNENYFIYQNGNEKGIINAANEKIISGNYNNIRLCGNEYLLLDTATPCDESDPKAVKTSLDTYHKFSYQLFSIKDKAILENIDFSHITLINDARGCENNIYIEDNQTKEFSEYIYYFEKEKWIESTNSISYLDNGNAIIDNVLYDSKGNTLIDPKDMGYTSILELNNKNICCIYNSEELTAAIIDNEKNTIIEGNVYDIYDSEVSHEGNILILDKSDKSGAIDITGKEIVPFKYDEVILYTDDIFAVRLDNCWGFYSASGKMLLEPTIEAEYYENECCFEIDGNRCIINPQNGEITYYKHISVLNDDYPGVYSVSNGGTRAIVTPTKNLTDFKYDLHGDSVVCSEDGKVILGARGSVIDVYTWQ